MPALCAILPIRLNLDSGSSSAMLNVNRLHRTLVTVGIFMDRAPCPVPKSEALSGFNCNRDLLKAAKANIHLETAGSTSRHA